MENAKPICSTLPKSSKLFERRCPKTKTEKAEMGKVPYASTVRSLMYKMVCSRPDIRYVVEFVNRL